MNIEQIECQRNFPFSKNTTYGLGGFADIAYFPKTEKQAEYVFDFLRENGKKFVVLGNGSNVLVSDKGFNGAVICTKKLKEISCYRGEVCCGSGVTVGELLNYCKENSLGGLEFFAGIPASVGGLAFMNAGAGGVSVSDKISSVKIYDGDEIVLSNSECDFTNKHSTMRDIICLILSVNFKVFSRKREFIAENIEKHKVMRESQPKGKSCGCVFKNVGNISAGKLIDEAGLKGLKLGGAEVSVKHANFIINHGGTANDVYKLIGLVKQKVYSRFGVELYEEVVYIGDFNETDG